MNNKRNYSCGLFGLPVLSFSKITLAEERVKDVPEHVLERGLLAHDAIQRALAKHNSLYVEISPIAKYKNKCFLIGHIDMLGVEGSSANIYEIKSSNYFSTNSKIVMLQSAYYKFLLAKSTNSRLDKIKNTLILYKIKNPNTDIIFDNLELKFMDLKVDKYIEDVKQIIDLYLTGKQDEIKRLLV